MSRKHLRILIATVVVLALIAGVTYGIVLLRCYLDVPVDAYASDWTAIFVIEHLKSTDKQWPANWEELRDEFDRMAKPSHYAWSFAQLQQRVDLRFDVVSNEVRDANPPLEVFRLTSGRRVSYNGDPNLSIREYLRTGKGGMEIE
jgi:hypothetical protein